jgi:hypothetical protein
MRDKIRQSATAQQLLRIIGGLLFAVLVMLGVAAYVNRGPPSELPDVAERLYTADGYMLVVRTPPSQQGVRADILLAGQERASPLARQVVREPLGVDLTPGATIEAVQLTPEQWQPLETLRANWCTAPPFFTQLDDTMPAYEIAVRCDLTTRRLRLSASDLPPELHLLLDVTTQHSP